LWVYSYVSTAVTHVCSFPRWNSVKTHWATTWEW